jgi:hypothetical protein
MSDHQGREDAVKTLVIHLNTIDFEIFEKYRGDLTPDAFMSALLRMIDTGAVRDKPSWIEERKP